MGNCVERIFKKQFTEAECHISPQHQLVHGYRWVPRTLTKWGKPVLQGAYPPEDTSYFLVSPIVHISIIIIITIIIIIIIQKGLKQFYSPWMSGAGQIKQFSNCKMQRVFIRLPPPCAAFGSICNTKWPPWKFQQPKLWSLCLLIVDFPLPQLLQGGMSAEWQGACSPRGWMIALETHPSTGI